MVNSGQINQSTGKAVLAEMFAGGKSAKAIVAAGGLGQVSDGTVIAGAVADVLVENPSEVISYRAGKLTVENFLFGQVMKKAGGKANPQVVKEELKRQLTGE
jgi:aspartyl-tRNA(Asn)/glutamyl-tRNA(Gln) amidotransferase subunit B